MRQEEYLAAIKKQQSLIRKLFANRKRRSEVIDDLTQERYDHLRGKFFKADGERFGVFKGVTFYIAAVHGDTKEADADTVAIRLDCRYVTQSLLYPGVRMDGVDGRNNIAFFTRKFQFALDDDLDEILAPLYITRDKAAEEVNAMYGEFIKNFLKKG